MVIQIAEKVLGYKAHSFNKHFLDNYNYIDEDLDKTNSISMSRISFHF